MRLILAVFACVSLAGPAFGCLNDRELPRHEREFRSDYGDPASSTVPLPAPPVPLAGQSSPVILGAGVALLTGALFLVVARGKAV